MTEKKTDKLNGDRQNDQGDCGCEGNCCPPKRNNTLAKIIFGIILLSAIGIIAVKLYVKPAHTTNKEACCPPGSSGECDTTMTTTCDTAKSSSCCPK